MAKNLWQKTQCIQNSGGLGSQKTSFNGNVKNIAPYPYIG